MEYVSLILSIIAVFITISYYLTKKRAIFKKHGIPYLPPQPIVGNMGQVVFGKRNMIDTLHSMYNATSDAKYFVFFEFYNPVIVLRDPELVKSVTVKNFEAFQNHRILVDKKSDPLFGRILFSLSDDTWKNMRSTLSPAFSRNKMKSMFALMAICGENVANYLSTLPEGERELELKDLFCKYANDVIASCAFGFSVDSIKEPNNAFYVRGRKITAFTGFINGIKMMFARNARTLASLLRMSLIKKSLTQFFVDVVVSTIKTRDELGIGRPDMLQLLLEARNRKEPGKEFTNEDVTANALAFFFGGFDTVSTQLSFIFYELALNPDVQERLQREVDQVLEERNGQLTYDIIHGMKYLDAVVNEAMRLHTIGPFLDRICVKPFELPPALPGGKPFVVTPGTNLWIPFQSIQTDPKHFENPQKFDPERFVTDGRRIMNSGTFMPFGFGPRMCIANRFAVMKIKTMVCYLVTRCNVKCCSRTSVPLKVDVGMFDVMAKDGFWVTFEARKNPPYVVPTSMINGTCKVEEDK